MTADERIKTLQVLDCTIRDGGYLNNWHFEDGFVRQMLIALGQAGVDLVEIGWRGTETYFSKEKYGTWRFTSEADIERVAHGLNLPTVSLMCNVGKIHEDDFLPRRESVVDLVRVVADREKVPMALDLITAIKAKGYRASLNATGFSNYSNAQVQDLVVQLDRVRPDFIFIADTYGSMLPDQVAQFLAPLIELEGVKVGFHPHNSLQMAFANTIEAIKAGVDAVDASIYGMGRGAGNLPLEVLLPYLQEKRQNKYNVLPVLNFIETHVMGLHRQIGWGYCLPYLLSGTFKCHPYFIRDIMNYKRFTVDEMWHILGEVQKNNPSTYVAGMIDDIIETHHIGWLGRERVEQMLAPRDNDNNDSPTKTVSSQQQVPYARRHSGRDFLILANGPTLKRYQDEIKRFIDRYRPIVMGANYLGGLFVPDYHAFTLTKRFLKYIHAVNDRSTLLISPYIPQDLVDAHAGRPFEHLYYQDVLKADFDIHNGVITTNCRTVSILLIGVATVMGANQVFVAGLDGYLGLAQDGQGRHFYREENDIDDERLNIERHKWCQYYLSAIDKYRMDQGHDGIKILTPTSYAMFYSGIENFI